jgi:hypothetical protein
MGIVSLTSIVVLVQSYFKYRLHLMVSIILKGANLAIGLSKICKFYLEYFFDVV